MYATPGYFYELIQKAQDWIQSMPKGLPVTSLSPLMFLNGMVKPLCWEAGVGIGVTKAMSLVKSWAVALPEPLNHMFTDSWLQLLKKAIYI